MIDRVQEAKSLDFQRKTREVLDVVCDPMVVVRKEEKDFGREMGRDTKVTVSCDQPIERLVMRAMPL